VAKRVHTYSAPIRKRSVTNEFINVDFEVKSDSDRLKENSFLPEMDGMVMRSLVLNRQPSLSSESLSK